MRPTILPLKNATFSKKDAGLLYSSDDRCFYVAKVFATAVNKTAASGTISYTQLNDKEKFWVSTRVGTKRVDTWSTSTP